MKIYDGVQAETAELIGIVSGFHYPYELKFKTSQQGFYLLFETDEQNQAIGWEAYYTTYLPGYCYGEWSVAACYV